MYKRNDQYLYSGFDEYPGRPDDFEAYGAFIVERRPEGAIATTIIPLFFIGWVGILGTLIPRDSGEKLRSDEIEKALPMMKFIIDELIPFLAFW